MIRLRNFLDSTAATNERARDFSSVEKSFSAIQADAAASRKDERSQFASSETSSSAANEAAQENKEREPAKNAISTVARLGFVGSRFDSPSEKSDGVAATLPYFS